MRIIESCLGCGSFDKLYKYCNRTGENNLHELTIPPFCPLPKLEDKEREAFEEGYMTAAAGENCNFKKWKEQRK